MLVRELMTNDITSLLTVNNYFGVLQGVLNNLGIGVLPDYLIRDFPNSCASCPTSPRNEVPVFLAYPEELRHSTPDRRIPGFRAGRDHRLPAEDERKRHPARLTRSAMQSNA